MSYEIEKIKSEIFGGVLGACFVLALTAYCIGGRTDTFYPMFHAKEIAAVADWQRSHCIYVPAASGIDKGKLFGYCKDSLPILPAAPAK